MFPPRRKRKFAFEPAVQGPVDNIGATKMDDKHENARVQFSAAIRALAASSDSIQTRLINANASILLVTIDEFDGDRELKIRFARILDLLAVDQDDMERVAVETTAHMTDAEAVKVADLICDFFYELV